MKLLKYRLGTDPTPRVGCLDGDSVAPIGSGPLKLSEILQGPDVAGAVRSLLAGATERLALNTVEILPPLDRQEVWAAGVTYERSKTAREEESEGAASFYDLVYRAPRPELFFKATPSRVVGPNQPVRIRGDARWSVPEPELALVLTPGLELVGHTIGNDMSARDIEGENPLYLPQAKMYDACCALGPMIAVSDRATDLGGLAIRLEIERRGSIVFEGETSTSRMARRFHELIDWLARDNLFPEGVILLTGTGVVPPDDFALIDGDLVRIAIDGVGVLENPVIQTRAKGGL